MLGLEPSLVGPLVNDCEMVPPEKSCIREIIRAIFGLLSLLRYIGIIIKLLRYTGRYIGIK